jgi:hypothetical protein
MTLCEYIITIHGTKLFNGSQAKFVASIFEAAGSIIDDISESTTSGLDKEYRNFGFQTM